MSKRPKTSKTRKFNWQINASSVAALLGKNPYETQEKAIAKTWQMNLKRMVRFGVQPSFSPTKATTEEVVTQKIEKQFEKKIEQGVSREADQKQLVREMKSAAIVEVKSMEKKVMETKKAVEAAAATNVIVEYPKIKAGVRKTRIGGYFAVGDRVYLKTSIRGHRKRNMAEANSKGWFDNVERIVENAKEQVVEAVKEANVANQVVANIEKQANKSINTKRGIKREATDLEIVQEKYPNVIAGNDRAYFLNVSRGDNMYGAFIIGRIDGFDNSTQTIFELKSRASRLFNSVTEYEEIQCMVYAKMLRKRHIVLVETFLGKQNFYPMSFGQDGLTFGPSNISWSTVEQGLENVVRLLNLAEQNVEYRQTLIESLY